MIVLRPLLLAALLAAGTPLAARSAQPLPQGPAAPAAAVPAQGMGPATVNDPDWFYRGSDIPRDPEWRFGTLPNGVRYALRRNAVPEGQVSIRVRIAAGSLHEADDERGWAHLVEHLAFRGTRSFGDREARHLWQQLGASFGSDTNASTSPNQTVYQLDLPDAEADKLDRSLKALAEMVDSARFEPAAVAAERQIVLRERDRRPELATRMQEASWPLFYGGLRLAERDPIGTPATIEGASPERLRAFYERWYRPDRATVIMVGDADPQVMEQLIAKHFGDWRAAGPAPAEPDIGAIAERAERIAALAYPGVPATATAGWLRPWRPEPATLARQRIEFAEALAVRILNRRLEAKARGEAAYVSAGVGSAEMTNAVDMTQLSVTARDGRWRDGLEQAFAILADATRAPPAESEIARELQNLRAAAVAALEGEKTVKSQARAQQLVGAIDRGDVVTNASTMVALLDRLAGEMTPQAVGAAYGRLFAGTGPRLFVVTPEPVQGGPQAIEAALAAAEKAAPAVRQAERTVGMDDLPALGPPGKVVSRREIADLGVTIVGFDNGATLTFKQTDFEKGSVGVQLRFGGGTLGLSPDRPTIAWAAGMVAPSGLADLDMDGLERLLTGRRITLGFGVGEDAYELRGATTAKELQDQMRLLATKLAHPRWDASVFDRYKSAALQSYDLAFASASARASREFSGVIRPGDARWSPVEKDRIAAAALPDLRDFFAARLAEGPLEAIVVGDVDLDTAIEAAAATIGALPARPEAPVPPAHLAVSPPAPNPEPRRFTHEGDPDQAFAMIGWTTFGGLDRIHERRALSVAANMLQVRLFDRLREEEGATYSPSAGSTASEILPEWGIFYASAELKPGSVDTFFRIAREEVAKLAAAPVEADEFARALNPVLSGIERRLKTNAYWLQAMENWVDEPRLVEQTRSFLADYKALTAEDVRRAVAAHVADQGDWSMLVLPGKAQGSGH